MSRRSARTVVSVVLALAFSTMVAGCSQSSVTTTSEPASTTTTTSSPSSIEHPPELVRATLLATAPPAEHELAQGSVVPLSDVKEISFATEQVGYGLGGAGGAAYPEKTTDGGRIWTIAGPAFFLPVADAALAVGAIDTDGPSEAYAYGGPGAGSTIDVTTDGGRRWWRTFLGQALVAAAQYGGKLWAFAIGDSSSSSSTVPPPVWLYVSSDGGRTWRYRSTLSGVAGWEADLVVLTTSTAVALVKSFHNDNPSSAGIVETTDGGGTWTKRTDPCNTEFSGIPMNWTERLAATSPRSFWLLCGPEPGAGFQYKVVERSYNGGKSWTLAASQAPGEHVPPNDIAPSGFLPDSGTTGLFAVTAPRDAWLVLEGNNVPLKTTDGGATWVRAASPAVEAQFPQQFSLVSGSAVVLTMNGLWATRQGHWVLIAGSSKAY